MSLFIQRMGPYVVVASLVLSALALVRSSDITALRLADQDISTRMDMEIRERERLDSYLREYRDLQMKNTAKIEILELQQNIH